MVQMAGSNNFKVSVSAKKFNTALKLKSGSLLRKMLRGEVCAHDIGKGNTFFSQLLLRDNEEEHG